MDDPEDERSRVQTTATSGSDPAVGRRVKRYDGDAYGRELVSARYIAAAPERGAMRERERREGERTWCTTLAAPLLLLLLLLLLLYLLLPTRMDRKTCLWRWLREESGRGVLLELQPTVISIQITTWTN